MPSQNQRIAFIGDVSGHIGPLTSALTKLRVDVRNQTIPQGLVVVQVGDLVHKGPNSNEIVAMVDGLIRQNPKNWIQLMGNHEAAHLGGPTFHSNCNCNGRTQATLERWMNNETMKLAVAVEKANGAPYLITHSGLTQQAWRDLGQPTTALDAAKALNQLLLTNPGKAMAAGSMLVPNTAKAGVVWAEAVTEVYQPWMSGEAPPFNQIHGHTTPYFFAGDRWADSVPKPLASFFDANSRVESRQRRSTVAIRGVEFVAIDPGYNENFGSRASMTAMEMDGMVLGQSHDIRPMRNFPYPQF